MTLLIALIIILGAVGIASLLIGMTISFKAMFTK